MAVELICQGFRDELAKRGNAILSEMEHVLEGAYIEDFDKLCRRFESGITEAMGATARLGVGRRRFRLAVHWSCARSQANASRCIATSNLCGPS